MAQQNARNYLSPTSSSHNSRREAVLKQAVVLASMMFDGTTFSPSQDQNQPFSNESLPSHMGGLTSR